MLAQLDLAIFHAVNSSDTPWLDALFTTASNQGVGLVALCLLLGWIGYRQRRAALANLLALGLAVALSDFVGSHVLKPWFGRVRPCFALPAGSFRPLLSAANVGSMPSLHAANSFAVALILTLIDKRLAWAAYPIATLVALSRVYGGVHWPSDVLGGALWGTFAASIAWSVTSWLGRHFQRP